MNGRVSPTAYRAELRNRGSARGRRLITAIRDSLFALVALVALSLVSCAHPRPDLQGPSTLITGATVIVGTGAPGRVASVRVRGDRIEEVGALEARAGEATVDGSGLVLAPGFIDTHSHHDRGIYERRDALAAVSQGITTIVVGQDGGSPYPLAEFFGRMSAQPAAVNVAAYVGHGTVRDKVMGRDFRRPATTGEIERMRVLVRDEMRAGALGLSTGLEYDPGIYSAPDEVRALAITAGELGGRYISHVRSEDRDFWQAIDEIIRIGRETRRPVQISHMKLAMRSLWGRADSLITVLERARAEGVDVTADVYPYTYWQSTLTVLFPKRDFESRESAEFALSQVSTASGLLLGQFDPDPSYVGKTVADVARLRGVDSVTALIALIREANALEERTGRGAESVIGTSMEERDVAKLLAWPHTNLCTDGALAGRHPRGFGAFPRFLGRLVRDQRVMSLEEGVRKMTSLSARHVGLAGRGEIRPGAFADLVLFDPATVVDRATPTEPQAPSVGIRAVWVNGEMVYRAATSTAAGETLGRYPGRVLRRGGWSPEVPARAGERRRGE